MSTALKAKHTPGPWKVKAAEFKGDNVVAYEITMPRAEISQGNADLIEAALDLGEALRAIVTQFKQFELEPDDPARALRERYWGDKIRAAEAALKKAGLL